MRRTNIYLDEKQTASLDRLADQQGVSRAELIRQLLDRALNDADDSLTADLRGIEDSFGILRNVHDVDEPDRRPGTREEHLERMWRGTS
ncbi:MAG: CopG family transcriptional regulator [Mycobacterium sp.]|nr:CopG family transcriptional regulator [Mycobacterium sp.]